MTGPPDPIERSWPPAPIQPGLPIPPVGPIGQPEPTWQVKRRWIPRLGPETLWGRFWRRFRRTFRRAGDAASNDVGCLDDVGGGILAAILFVVFVLVAVFVVFPAVVAIIDLAVLLLLALGGLVARVAFRRPWLIDARDGTGRVLRWRVVGWKASAERVEDIRRQLAAGQVPADAEVFRDRPVDPDDA